MKPDGRMTGLVNALEHCQNDAQVLDADNDRYIRDHVIGKRLTVTSVRKMASDFSNGIYVVIGFTDSDGNDGLFSIGGNGARYPLMLSRFNHLPADLVLFTANTPHGPVHKWKRADA